jgi:hypothetical protein
MAGGGRRRQRDFILHGENIGEIAVVVFGPDVLSPGGLGSFNLFAGISAKV